VRPPPFGTLTLVLATKNKTKKKIKYKKQCAPRALTVYAKASPYTSNFFFFFGGKKQNKKQNKNKGLMSKAFREEELTNPNVAFLACMDVTLSGWVNVFIFDDCIAYA
jgi:hypothetical protein